MDLNVRRMAAGLLVVAAGSTLAPACADNETSLFIRAVQAPNEMCEFDLPSNDVAVRGNGVMDVRVTPTYVAALVVGNQLVARGDEDQIRTETSRVRLTAADVNILDSSEAILQRADGSEAAFEVPVTGFIDPGQGSEPGYGTATVLMVDSGTTDQLRAQLGPLGRTDLIISLIIRGRTLGGNELETGEFLFPLHVCDGCLAKPSEADDPASMTKDCDNVTELDEEACFLGQDLAVDCCRVGLDYCNLLP